MRRLLRWFVVLIVLGVVAYAGLAYFWGVPNVAQHATVTDEEAIAAGRYLAVAGDCASCHTAVGGEAFAGGRAIDTPFGTIYSPNITPDAETGIGGMSSADFYRIMVYGADSVLAPLYPAMPYTSFHLISRDDSDNLHGYFMSLPAVEATVKPDDLAFPFDLRPLMFGWNLMFAERGAFEPDPLKDAAWNRGAYLTNGLGHCGECHTPRNLFGAMESGEALAGARVGEFEAPDLRAEALKARDWTTDDLALFFETGASPEGSAFGDMFLAVKNSLRLLTHDDRMAIAIYLMDSDASAPSKGDAAVEALGDQAHPNRSGQSLYITHCALCHGPQGQGVPSAMPPLMGNSTVAQADGVNLVEAVWHGIPEEHMNLTSGYGPMPAFQDRLSAAQVADLANYLRSAFGGSEDLPALDDSDVKRILE